MKKKRVLLLILQVILVLASVFFLISYTNKQVKLTPVYMYNTNIDDVTYVLKEEDIRMVEIPASAITSSFALSKEDIVGKAVETSVKGGQYVYSDQLSEPNQIDVFKTMDLSNYRKFSLPITMEASFSGNLKRGDYVDLLYTQSGTNIAEGGYQENPYTYTKTFMQSVLVYQVNAEDGSVYVDKSQRVPNANTSNDTANPTATEDGGNKPISIITLAVTMEQAQEIEARLQTGKIRFVGRFDGSKDYESTGFTIGETSSIKLGKDDPELGNDESGTGTPGNGMFPTPPQDNTSNTDPEVGPDTETDTESETGTGRNN